jgi:hypothetical protein
MRPWYLDAPGFGALPSNPAYSQALGQLQALANAAPAVTSAGILSSFTTGTAELPGQVAYTIDVVAQAVAQFSGGDPQAMAANANWQTLLAQEQAVIANGDYVSATQHNTNNYYTQKGNYNVNTVVAAASALIPFVSGLTGSGTSSTLNPAPNTPSNGTFVPVAPPKILTARGNTSVTGATTVPSGQTVAPIFVPLSPVTIGPNGQTYNPTTGVTTNNPPPAGFTPPAPSDTPASTSSGDAPPPASTTLPNGSTVTTDPSTGSTIVTTTNPDGSTTVTTSGGPGGEPTSYTTPAPYFGVFHPRDDSGKLVLAFGLGAMALGLLVLAVNSEEGEKALAVVAKPVDDAAKTVGIPDIELPSLPEFGPTLNPIKRRRRKISAKAKKLQKVNRANRLRKGRGAVVRFLKARGYSKSQIKRSLRSSKRAKTTASERTYYYAVYYKNNMGSKWRKHTDFTTRARAVEVAKKMIAEGSVAKARVVKE